MCRLLRFVEAMLNSVEAMLSFVEAMLRNIECGGYASALVHINNYI